MIPAKGYAVHHAADQLAPWNFDRRDVGPHDVLLEILYSGICHSDIHQVRSEWGPSVYPMVPGHEIVGRIIKVGDQVKKFTAGQLGGIGCMVDSCRECESCRNHQEQFCKKGCSPTYNGFEQDKKTPTYGGYSNQIVCAEEFVLYVADSLPLKGVAPLLCAGITTYSPLKKWGIGKEHKVGVLGLGGLGHMAVKFASSFGAEVTMLSRSNSKKADAERLGAHYFCNTTDGEQAKKLNGYFDFIVDTVSAPHNYDMYLGMLKTNGVHICVGIPPEPIHITGFKLLGGNKTITGSSIGGIAETQEMLDYCAAKNIVSDVEVINIDYVNEAYERVMKSDVKYRFVIDMSTLS